MSEYIYNVAIKNNNLEEVKQELNLYKSKTGHNDYFITEPIQNNEYIAIFHEDQDRIKNVAETLSKNLKSTALFYSHSDEANLSNWAGVFEKGELVFEYLDANEEVKISKNVQELANLFNVDYGELNQFILKTSEPNTFDYTDFLDQLNLKGLYFLSSWSYFYIQDTETQSFLMESVNDGAFPSFYNKNGKYYTKEVEKPSAKESLIPKGKKRNYETLNKFLEADIPYELLDLYLDPNEKNIWLLYSDNSQLLNQEFIERTLESNYNIIQINATETGVFFRIEAKDPKLKYKLREPVLDQYKTNTDTGTTISYNFAKITTKSGKIALIGLEKHPINIEFTERNDKIRTKINYDVMTKLNIKFLWGDASNPKKLSLNEPLL